MACIDSDSYIVLRLWLYVRYGYWIDSVGLLQCRYLPSHFSMMGFDDVIGRWKVSYNRLRLKLAYFFYPSCHLDSIALSGGVGNKCRHVRFIDTVGI